MHHWLEDDPKTINDFLKNAGHPKFRSTQFWQWLHKKRVESYNDMSNLPAALRTLLAENGTLRTLRELEQVHTTDNLTGKWLFAPDCPPEPDNQFESVLIVEKRLRRRTVCVSSMIGCPLGCEFCATGKLGFSRNLSASEMIEQVYRLDNYAHKTFALGVSHVVFMGMGEPLLNLDAVLQAANSFSHPEGMGISGRHITISTAGIPEGIDELIRQKKNYRLALSLHAPNQTLREQIMPVAKRWPLDQLFASLEKFSDYSSRSITFEYCLIHDVNDKPSQARELAALVKRVQGKVNLIPWNTVAGVTLRPSSPTAIKAFQHTLEALGISAPLRAEKGSDIAAACGQLRAARKQKYIRRATAKDPSPVMQQYPKK